MVSSLSIALIFISILLSIIFPIVLIIVLKKKTGASLKAFFIGVLTFIIFVTVLEQGLHGFFLIKNKTTADFLNKPWAYMLYGGIMAGIFEEVGRFIMIKFFLKSELNFNNSIAFGLGHGGIEAILIGGIANINILIYSFMINSNTFDFIIKKASPSTLKSLDTLKMQLINSNSYIWLLSGIERIMALIIQVALSILIFKAIENKKNYLLLIAIFLHALVDFPAALSQKGALPITLVYILTLVATVIAFLYIFNNYKKQSIV